MFKEIAQKYSHKPIWLIDPHFLNELILHVSHDLLCHWIIVCREHLEYSYDFEL